MDMSSAPHESTESGETMGTSPPVVTTATSAAIPTPAPSKKSRSREAANAGSPSLAAIAIPSSASSSTASLSAAPSPALPQRSPSQSSLTRSTSHHSHRHSFAGSPRTQRHPSFTQAALQELLSRPADPHRNADPRFAGRDWHEVTVGELVSSEELKWAEMDTSVEHATKTLLKNGGSNAVLIREEISSNFAISTFDYNDLNSYLLVVVGLAKPDEDTIELYDNIASKAREGRSILLSEIQPICRKEDLVTLQASETLDKAIEVLGGGVHRALVLDGAKGVVGILSQSRLVEFFWNEGVHFHSIEALYPISLRDLGIGTPGPHIVAINSDAPLADALTSMQNEGLSSIAVVDNGYNVTGNISTVDVKHLTSTSSAPLLQDTCMHFISVILSERGVEEGRDPFPVFHVSPYSTLAHVVAKLMATRSHRMWVVEGPSPAPSAPVTPQLAPTVLSTSVPQSPLPLGPQAAHTSVPASAMPGAHLSGRLTGVVSLTDVLNIFARSSGLHPLDPNEQRARRRRSSSSSVRPSLDGSRPSLDIRR